MGRFEERLDAAGRDRGGTDRRAVDLQWAWRQLQESTRAIRERQIADARRELGEICDTGPRGTTHALFMAARHHPNVLRQALLDMPPSLRAATKYVLCRFNLKVRADPPRECVGASGGPYPARDVQVDRSSPDYPYESDNRYKIRRLPDGTTEVELTVYVQADAGIPDTEKTQTLDHWRTQARTYYDAQAAQARVENPALPAMRFKIATAEIPNMPMGGPGVRTLRPRVSLHRCWRAEIGSSVCSEVRGYAVRECRRGCEAVPANYRVAGAPGCEAHCDGAYPVSTPWTANREDSGNLTPNTSDGTIRHEFGHMLGLNDEYQDPTYLFARLGEHDSVMNNNHERTARFYPRHFEQILAPASCEAVRPR